MPPQDTETARWFATEVHPHETALRSYLRAHFPPLRDIDDLVQEAYARVIQARHHGRLKEARPYLFSIARNAAIDLCRRNQIISFETIAENATAPVVDEGADAASSFDHDHELDLLAAVRGRYTPREALGRMLDRTNLVVTRDERAGTLAIRSGTESRAPAPPPSASAAKKNRPHETPELVHARLRLDRPRARPARLGCVRR